MEKIDSPENDLVTALIRIARKQYTIRSKLSSPTKPHYNTYVQTIGRDLMSLIDEIEDMLDSLKLYAESTREHDLMIIEIKRRLDQLEQRR